jgi:hypothetical protein
MPAVLGINRTQASELNELIKYLTPQELSELDTLLEAIDAPTWMPQEGPQTEALNSLADITFYGGAAGGGKTDLLLGTTFFHDRSIIFRREYGQLRGIIDRSRELYQPHGQAPLGRYNSTDKYWRCRDGRIVEFGAVQLPGDEQKFQGRPHDFKGFDEITHFTEAQFRFLCGWNRTTVPGQRSRVIAAGNPPTTPQGRWVHKYWAAWLDPLYPNPAKPGELRWFVTNDKGEDVEVSDNTPRVMLIAGRERVVYPRSRTFIKAMLQDNAYLTQDASYISVLQAMPEPLRSRMLDGNFGVTEEDDEWQVIPTMWILQAQARWKPSYEEYLQALAIERLKKLSETANKEQASESTPGHNHLASTPVQGQKKEVQGSTNLIQHPNARPLAVDASDLSLWFKPGDQLSGQSGVDLSALLTPEQRKLNADNAILQAVKHNGSSLYSGGRDLGVDVARGGRDYTILSERQGFWFNKLIAVPGAETPDGPSVIKVIVDNGFKEWRCKIDVIGVGSSPVDVGKSLGMNVVAMIGSSKSYAQDRADQLSFANARSEWMWSLREALDPSLGLDIALPPDPDLAAELAAPRWALTPRGIAVEPKEDVKERLGHSPDKSEAVINAWAQPVIQAEGFLAYYREQVEEAQNRKKLSNGARRKAVEQGEIGAKATMFASPFTGVVK